MIYFPLNLTMNKMQTIEIQVPLKDNPQKRESEIWE